MVGRERISGVLDQQETQLSDQGNQGHRVCLSAPPDLRRYEETPFEALEFYGRVRIARSKRLVNKPREYLDISPINLSMTSAIQAISLSDLSSFSRNLVAPFFKV